MKWIWIRTKASFVSIRSLQIIINDLSSTQLKNEMMKKEIRIAISLKRVIIFFTSIITPNRKKKKKNIRHNFDCQRIFQVGE